MSGTLSPSGRVRGAPDTDPTHRHRLRQFHGSSRDRVDNRGYAASPLAMMYHVNIGWPIVSPGARVEVAGRRVGGHEIADRLEAPRRGTQAEGLHLLRYSRTGGHGHRPRCSTTTSMASIPRGSPLRWNAAALPSLVRWQVANVAGHYVLGLEPSTALRVDDARGHEFPTLRARRVSRSRGLDRAQSEIVGLEDRIARCLKAPSASADSVIVKLHALTGAGSVECCTSNRCGGRCIRLPDFGRKGGRNRAKPG